MTYGRQAHALSRSYFMSIAYQVYDRQAHALSRSYFMSIAYQVPATACVCTLDRDRVLTHDDVHMHDCYVL